MKTVANIFSTVVKIATGHVHAINKVNLNSKETLSYLQEFYFYRCSTSDGQDPTLSVFLPQLNYTFFPNMNPSKI